MSYEDIIMGLIVKGGDARGKALLAVKAAKENDFEKADELMKECGALLLEAHEIQTDMIQDEINGNESKAVSLLMVHGQDHLMNALTVKELAAEFIEMYRVLSEQGILKETKER